MRFVGVLLLIAISVLVQSLLPLAHGIVLRRHFVLSFTMDRLTVQTLKHELLKRQLDSRGVKSVLKQRLRAALIEEGCDPDSYVSDFGVPPSASAQGSTTHPAADDVHSAPDVGPGDSASQVSRRGDSRSALSHGSASSQRSRSSVRSSASRLLDEAVKKADLSARASMSKLKRDMEAQELQMRWRREDLELQTEMIASEARSRAILEEEERFASGGAGGSQSQPSKLRAEADVFQPSHTRADFYVPVRVDRPAPELSYSGLPDPVEGAGAQLSHLRCGSAAAVGRPDDVPDGGAPLLVSPSRLASDDNDRQVDRRTHEAGPGEQVHPATGAVSIPGHPEAEQNLIMKALLAQQVRGSLPKLEIQKFSGCITDYVSFIKTFDNMIASKLEDYEEKLHFLEQFTTGEPQDIVRGCLMLPAADGYAKARERLQQRYGDERRMASALLDKLLSWPSVKYDDIRALDKLSIFLGSCSTSMPQSSTSVKELDQPGVLRGVMEKLPAQMQDRWRRSAVSIQDSGRRVAFDDLARFVENEVRVASDPLFGKQATTQHAVKVSSHVKADGRSQCRTSCLATSFADDSNGRNCRFCEGEHLLSDCSMLQQRGSAEKREFVMKHSLCFGCLGRGHRVAECKRRKTCKVCKGRHPTVLHEHRPEAVTQPSPQSTSREKVEHDKAVDAVAGASQVQGASGMSVIPVRVRVDSGRAVSTYAFLDNGSSATFCTESLLRELGIEDVEATRLTLYTVDPEVTRVESKIVTNLQVSDMSETQFLTLPPVYTLPKIPVTHDDIPRQQDLQAWPHLHSIHLQDVQADICLMIGSNVPEAMEPWDVLHGMPGEPFATKTKLGWVVNGPVKPKKSDAIRVNRVGVSEDLSQMFMKMYDEDVKNSSAMDDKGMSREHHLRMDRVNASCARPKSEHYQIALPFREDNRQLRNKRLMVSRRLAGLKRELATGNKLHQENTSFMTDMITKVYAEAVPESEEKKGKTWCIPHHGVSHPQRPDRLRVVCDRAATFHGASLNSILLQDFRAGKESISHCCGPGPSGSNSLSTSLLEISSIS